MPPVMPSFDPFRLDLANQCLWRGQTRVALMPKPFDLLVYLVRNAGRLVTQDELLKAVWPGTHVQSDVLRKHIKEIRRVLGDAAATPRFIETQPKRGYRFIAPVHEWSRATPPVSQAGAALVGRAAVFAALDEHLRRALGGERQLVFLTGEPGIGKTSVVNAFEGAADAAPTVRVAWGQAVEGFAGKEPYYPLLEALGRLGRGQDGGLIVEALAACAPTWLIQLPSLLPPEQRAALSRDVIGATTPRMVREFCDALEAIARTSPLVLVLEDLHWADHSTLDALSGLARRREPARLLIVGTHRPVVAGASRLRDLERDLGMHRLAHEIALTPLTVEDVAEHIAASFVPNTFTGDLAVLLHRHSGGNPLFVSAMLDHLVQRRVIEREDAGWRMTIPLERVGPDVPETLRHILELQLEQLTHVEIYTLMCASVAGERFAAWDAARMLHQDEIETEGVFDALVRRGQFLRAANEVSAGRPSSAVYEFTHALYRDALYQRLPAALRTRYHRRLAEALDTLHRADSEEVAGKAAAHYEAAAVYDKAVTHTMIAAQTALRRYAHAEGLALLAHAGELNRRTQDGDRGRRDVELFARIGDVEYAHGEMPRSADAYEQAAAAAIEQRLSAAAAQALLRAARSAAFFDVPRALADCQRAAQIAGEAGRSGLQARARLVTLCWELLHGGWSRDRATDAAAVFDVVLQSPADQVPDDHILYANVQVFRSEYADACARADAALRQLTTADTLWEHLGARAAKAGALSLLGRWGEACDTLTAAIELARKNDNAPWLDILTALLGSVHLQAFDFAGARALVCERLSAPTGAGSLVQMHLTVVKGGAELGLGRVADASRCFAAVRAASRGDLPIVHWYWRLQAQLGLAEAALTSGDLRAAVEEASQLTEAASTLDETFVVALAWECRARVHAAANAIDLADASIEQALQRLARGEVPAAAWRVHATAAAVRRVSDPSRVATHLERARTLLIGLSASLDGHPRLQQSLLRIPAIRALLGA